MVNNILININQVYTLARYTLHEATHTQFFFVLLSLIGIAIGLELFLDQVALFEKNVTQTALMSAFLRLATLYLMGLFVVSSITQELNQQTIYIFMALPLSRVTYLLGKLLGFSFIALLICVAIGLLLLLHTPPIQLLIWLTSLYFELLLIICLGVFFSLSLYHTLLALSSLMGFYLLARSIHAIQLTAYRFQDSTQGLEQALFYISQFIALLLPDLSRFTRSEWLIYETGQWGILIELMLQTIIYILLIISASLFDFYRKNL